jgi:hypothetical protein
MVEKDNVITDQLLFVLIIPKFQDALIHPDSNKMLPKHRRLK